MKPSSKKTPIEKLLSLSEAAKISGLSHDHLRTLVRTGKVWGAKIGRNWVTTESAVMKYTQTERKPGRKSKSE